MNFPKIHLSDDTKLMLKAGLGTFAIVSGVCAGIVLTGAIIVYSLDWLVDTVGSAVAFLISIWLVIATMISAAVAADPALRKNFKRK